MKNIYLFVALLLCAVGYSQDLQNAKWYFGMHSGLDFLPDMYNPTGVTSPLYTSEGCATVSDSQGNLLFLTDGTSLYDASHTLITDDLLGDWSSTSSAIFVKKPQDSTRYYVVTIDGTSGNTTHYGLHYSEISTSGSIISLNVPFEDHDGKVIDDKYESLSEKLTSTIHADGESYWIVAQIKDKIYSYKVSASGIDVVPVASDAPIDVDVVDTTYSGIGYMKISPNTQRIGVCYHYESANDGFLMLGDFNYATGQVTFDNTAITIPGQTGYYGLEFSPDSNYAFFTTLSALGSTQTQRGRGEEKREMNIYTVSAQKATESFTPVLVGSIPLPENTQRLDEPEGPTLLAALQLSINGNIYVAAPWGTYLDNLSVITDPNDGPLATFYFNTVPAGSVGGIRLGLPQWVHNNTGDVCPSYIVLEGPDLMGEHTYSYSDYIHTQNGYEVYGDPLILKAGNHIVLGDDTYIGWGGADFLAIIKPCGEPAIEEPEEEFVQRKQNNSTVAKLNAVTVYPNPANDMVTVSAIENMANVNLISLQGKILYRHQFEKPGKTHTFDVSGLSKGLYIIAIQSEGGEITSSKLAIN